MFVLCFGVRGKMSGDLKQFTLKGSRFPIQCCFGLTGDVGVLEELSPVTILFN